MDEKKTYWRAWNRIIPEKGERDFWISIKGQLKENFKLYKYFSDAELLYTFQTMIRERNYRSVDLALVKRFIHEFAGVSKAPQGILLVDDILEAMNNNCPVISSNTSSMKEVGGNAVEYFNTQNIKQLTNN